jgi:hypothetical protein
MPTVNLPQRPPNAKVEFRPLTLFSTDKTQATTAESAKSSGGLDSSRRSIAAAKPANMLTPADRYVAEISRGLYLRNFYDDSGLSFTETLSECRLFRSYEAARNAIQVLGGIGSVHRVLVDASGKNVRIALMHHREVW